MNDICDRGSPICCGWIDLHALASPGTAFQRSQQTARRAPDIEHRTLPWEVHLDHSEQRDIAEGLVDVRFLCHPRLGAIRH